MILETIMAITYEENIVKLEFYIKTAVKLITQYLNRDLGDEYIRREFEVAIIQIVCNAINCSKSNGIKSFTQGSRSVTYADNKSFCITEDIANLLPVPFVKLR